MNKKVGKIQVKPPFEEITNNWELVIDIEASLNRYLTKTKVLCLEDQTSYQSLGKNGLEQLISITKKMMQFIEAIKKEHKTIEYIKQNAITTQQKLDHHQEIIRSHEKKFTERTKAMVEENRVLKQTNQKLKKSYIDNQQMLHQSLEQTKKEMSELNEELKKLRKDKESLLLVINQLQEELFIKQETINRLQKIDEHLLPTLMDKEKELIQIKIERKKDPQYYPQPAPVECSIFEKIGIVDLDALSKILSYLNPSDIFSLASTSKRYRFLSRTQSWIKTLCQSIIAIKNRQIGYYHKHIQYFEKLCHKIPEEVLQMTLFKYHILKESAGQQIMQALNASSLIFQGRFEGEELYNGLPNYDKQIPTKLPFEEAQIMDVDASIVEQFREDRSHEKDQLVKLFQQMYGKITTTYQLYRADEETSRLFISNTLKHISRVFVLAKSLYLQVQNLQQLNSFLLSELNKWDRMEIDKALQLEDLRAELEAEKKLKVFFTDKSIKSEQKALLEENLKLTYEMKYKKLNDLFNLTSTEKEELLKKLESLTQSNEKLKNQYRDLRRGYQSIREKYNHVVQELVVVKETIIKMNIN